MEAAARAMSGSALSTWGRNRAQITQPARSVTRYLWLWDAGYLAQLGSRSEKRDMHWEAGTEVSSPG